MFQEEVDQVKSDQEYMEYFSMIDFTVDGYVCVSASRAYPGFLIDSIDLAE